MVDLFLVDVPIQYNTQDLAPGPSSVQPALRFPYSGNRGGLYMPQPAGYDMCTPMRVLINAFGHKWQVDLIFSPKTTFPNVPLLYMLVNSSWVTRYLRLDSKIKDVCLRQMRNPRDDLIHSLHDLREELSNLRTSIEETIFYSDDNVKAYYETLRKKVVGINMRQSPIEGNLALKENADKLNAFFMENIQMLLGIISIRDAQQSIRRANQGMILTALASVYLPLSLATGIFGMNLKELTGQGPSVWVFIVTWLAVFLVTGIVAGVAFKDTIVRYLRDKTL